MTHYAELPATVAFCGRLTPHHLHQPQEGDYFCPGFWPQDVEADLSKLVWKESGNRGLLQGAIKEALAVLNEALDRTNDR